MRRSIYSAIAVLALAPVVAGVGAAQEADPSSEELIAYAYSFQHRGASEALELALPLLSSRGAIELQRDGNALVVRDTASVLRRIRPRFLAFDQPLDPLRVRLQIVRAEPESGQPGPSPDLPPGVLSRLHELLKYQRYSLLAGAEFEIAEGTKAVQDVGEKYRVDFRLKHLLSEDRASLQGFRLSSPAAGGEFASLIHTDLVLDLDRPMVLGLAPSEASDTALMLVIELMERSTATASVK